MSEPVTNPQETQMLASFAQQVLRIEAQAVAQIVIDQPFHQAVQLILERSGDEKNGAVVVSGLGKSGLIGQKIAATFASTGTPSHFLHPTEAMHGDLGRVRHDDVVLMLSRSGNTDELVMLATILKQDQVPVLAMVANRSCDLDRLATATLCIGNVAEPCPHGLTPTASSTAMLALGDALALCVMKQRNFTPTQFSKMHPGGTLGRQLMLVTAAMRFKATENLPLVDRRLTIKEAYAQAEQYVQASGLRRAGAMLIVDGQGRLAGIFTDGDLRLSLVKEGVAAYDQPIEKFMTRSPRTLSEKDLVRDAVQLVREHRFDEVPVIDSEGRPLGLIDVQDLMALKVIDG